MNYPAFREQRYAAEKLARLGLAASLLGSRVVRLTFHSTVPANGTLLTNWTSVASATGFSGPKLQGQLFVQLVNNVRLPGDSTVVVGWSKLDAHRRDNAPAIV